MIALAVSSVRRHRAAYAGTFIAAFLAVVLLVGAGLLLFSVLVAKPPADRFAAASVVVSGQRDVSLSTTTHKGDKTKTKTKSERLSGAGTLPVGLAEEIASVDGVRAAIADWAFMVVLPGPGADGAPVIGHGWSSAALTPFTLTAGRAPAAGEVVVDANLAARGHLRVGDRIPVTTRTGTRTMTVAGVAAPPGRAGLAGQGAVFMADAEVPAVSGLTGPTAVGVLAEPGVDRGALVRHLRVRAGEAPVLTGEDRARADLPGALPDYIAPISVFGFTIGITGFAAVFVLTGTVALAVRQRLRELALLRTVGATPGQLRRLLGIESVALAAVAAVPALPLGVVAARLMAARFRTLGAVPAQFTVTVNAGVLAAAAVAAMLVAFLAARLAARRAVRLAPTQAMTESVVAPRGGTIPRVLVALATGAGAIAVLTVVPLDGPLGMGMSFVSSSLLLCAVAALGPVLARPLLAVLGRGAGLVGVTGWLAGAVSRARRRHVAAVAVPLALMFALNATMLLNSSLLGALAQREQTARNAPATAQVVMPGGLPLATVEELTSLPGVAGSAATFPTRVVLGSGGKPQDYAAQGLRTTGSEPALDLNVRTGELGGAGAFAASRYLITQQGWRIGEEVRMWLADGHPVTLRLSAAYERARGFGDLVLPAELVAGHDPRGLAAAVALRYDGDLSAEIGSRWPAMRLVPALATDRSADAHDRQGAWEVMLVVSLSFTAIAVVNNFAMAAAGRRREYADLRLAGATTGQVHRTAWAEAAIAVAVGLALGAAVTGIVVGVFSTAQDGVFRVLVDPSTYAAMVGGVGLLGLLAGALPVRLVVRRRSLPDLTARVS